MPQDITNAGMVVSALNDFRIYPLSKDFPLVM
jgi:hypothetical protein